MRQVLPSRRMCAAENPHSDRECLHPCDNVGDILYPFDELMFAVKICLRLRFQGLQVIA